MSTYSWDDIAFDARGELVDVTQRREPGPPPDTTWTRLDMWALTGDPIFGKVVAVSDHRGIEYNLVVASEIFTDTTGAWVHLVDYERFCQWGRIPPKTRPRTPTPARAVLAKHVWVGHDRPAEEGSKGA